MARCPKLEYKRGSGGWFSECEYVCILSRQSLKASDPQVKCTCDSENGYKYENCDIYKRNK